MRRRAGFTLIELLIVIVIIGILMAMLLPSLAAALCNARAGNCSAVIRQIEAACEQYEKEQNIYPPSATGAPFDADLPAGDGMNCYSVLTEPSVRGLPYLEKESGTGSWINSVEPVYNGAPNKIQYRNNNLTNSGPPKIMNAFRIDIFSGSCAEYTSGDMAAAAGDDAFDGLNNWRR